MIGRLGVLIWACFCFTVSVHASYWTTARRTGIFTFFLAYFSTFRPSFYQAGFCFTRALKIITVLDWKLTQSFFVELKRCPSLKVEAIRSTFKYSNQLYSSLCITACFIPIPEVTVGFSAVPSPCSSLWQFHFHFRQRFVTTFPLNLWLTHTIGHSVTQIFSLSSNHVRHQNDLIANTKYVYYQHLWLSS